MKKSACGLASEVSINGVDCLAFLTESQFCWIPISLCDLNFVERSLKDPNSVNLHDADGDALNSIELVDLLQVTRGYNLPDNFHTTASDRSDAAANSNKMSKSLSQLINRRSVKKSADESPSRTDLTPPASPEITVAEDDRYLSLYSIAHLDVRLRLYRLRMKCATQNLATDWLNSLRRSLARVSETQRRPRTLLCFIHPTSGRGLAKRHFKKVHPLFSLAGVKVKTVITSRQNDLYDTIMADDMSNIDGIVCIGGDGTFTDLLRCVLLRTRRDAGLPIDEDRREPLAGSQKTAHSLDSVEIPASWPIGVIPAGSTDATAHSLHGTNDAVTCALRMCRGDRLPTDVATVYKGSRFVRYCVNNCSYGFFGDVIAPSEKLRYLGPHRYDLLGFAAWCRNDSYQVEMELTLAPDTTCSCPSENAPLNPLTDIVHSIPETGRKQVSHKKMLSYPDRIERKHVSTEPCYADCKQCRCTCAAKPPVATTLKTVSSLPTMKVSDSSTDGLSPKLSSVLYGRPLGQAKVLRLSGSYFVVMVSTLSCRSDKTQAGTAPLVHHGDGVAQLTLVRQCSRFQSVRFLSHMNSFESEVSSVACRRHSMLATLAFTSQMQAYNQSLIDFTSNFNFTEVHRITEIRLRPLVRRDPIARKVSDASSKTNPSSVTESDNHRGYTDEPPRKLSTGVKLRQKRGRATTETNAAARQCDCDGKPFGRWNNDGEVMEQDEEWTTIRINRQLIQVFSAGIPSPENLRAMRLESIKRATANTANSRCLPELFAIHRDARSVRPKHQPNKNTKKTGGLTKSATTNVPGRAAMSHLSPTSATAASRLVDNSSCDDSSESAVSVEDSEAGIEIMVKREELTASGSSDEEAQATDQPTIAIKSVVSTT